VGRTGQESTIWLNFDGACGQKMNGTVIHETMHSLGVDHHHIRYDRNAFVGARTVYVCLHLQIQVNHDKIDPQAYDIFAHGNTKAYTSYGVPYDLYSIMHYNAYVSCADVVHVCVCADGGHEPWRPIDDGHARTT
jgi:hypothetical protein